MAEGVEAGAPGLDEGAEAPDMEMMPDTPGDPPVVRPKVRAAQQGLGRDAGAEPPHADGEKAVPGEWGGSPAQTDAEAPWSPESRPAGAAFQGWRERRWDDEAEGSYITSLGSSTLDILRGQFGEASFREPPAWQPWAAEAGGAPTWQGGGLRRSGGAQHPARGRRSTAEPLAATPTTVSLEEAMRGGGEAPRNAQGIMAWAWRAVKPQPLTGGRAGADGKTGRPLVGPFCHRVIGLTSRGGGPRPCKPRSMGARIGCPFSSAKPLVMLTFMVICSRPNGP